MCVCSALGITSRVRPFSTKPVVDGLPTCTRLKTANHTPCILGKGPGSVLSHIQLGSFERAFGGSCFPTSISNRRWRGRSHPHTCHRGRGLRGRRCTVQHCQAAYLQDREALRTFPFPSLRRLEEIPHGEHLQEPGHSSLFLGSWAAPGSASSCWSQRGSGIRRVRMAGDAIYSC